MCALDVLFFINARMALLSLLISMGFILYFYIKSIKFFIALILISSLGFASFFMAAHSIDKRLSSIYSETKLYYSQDSRDTSGNNRLYFWEISIDQFTKAPILGNGSGSFKQYMIEHNDPVVTIDSVFSHAHNEYITQLSQYGICGLFLFLCMIFMALRQSLQIKDPWFSKTIFISTLIFSINAITDSSLHNPWEGWTFILVLSIISIQQNLKSNK